MQCGSFFVPAMGAFPSSENFSKFLRKFLILICIMSLHAPKRPDFGLFDVFEACGCKKNGSQKN
jgi:hypothetical protein